MTASPLKQVLLGDQRAQAVVVVMNFADELVQAGLEDFLLRLFSSRVRILAGMTLRRTLAAVGARDVVECSTRCA